MLLSSSYDGFSMLSICSCFIFSRGTWVRCAVPSSTHDFPTGLARTRSSMPVAAVSVGKVSVSIRRAGGYTHDFAAVRICFLFQTSFVLKFSLLKAEFNE